MNPPDGFLLVYSVVDRASFQRVESALRQLQEIDLIRTKAVVIVANKIDLARSRSVSAQGKLTRNKVTLVSWQRNRGARTNEFMEVVNFLNCANYRWTMHGRIIPR